MPMLPLAEVWGLICIKQTRDGAGCPTCGHPVLLTLFAADHRTDVIVMGTVQHKGLNTLLGTPRDEPLAGTSRGDFLQVQTMDDLTAVIGIIVRLKTQGFGQVAHGGVAGGINRIHLTKTILASSLDQMFHQ